MAGRAGRGASLGRGGIPSSGVHRGGIPTGGIPKAEAGLKGGTTIGIGGAGANGSNAANEPLTTTILRACPVGAAPLQVPGR